MIISITIIMMMATEEAMMRVSPVFLHRYQGVKEPGHEEDILTIHKEGAKGHEKSMWHRYKATECAYV